MKRALHIVRRVGQVAVLVTLTHLMVLAQPSGPLPSEFDGIDIVEKFGDFVPGGISLQTADGDPFLLGDAFDGETPILLNFVYHDCPMLCSVVLDGLTQSLSSLAWTPGAEFKVLTISFDPADTAEKAAGARDLYTARYGKEIAAGGWEFLVGEEDQIERLTEAVGFQYRWIEEQQEFGHAAALVFLSGNGEVTRYLYGVKFPALQMKAAISETAGGLVGSMMDKIIVSCLQYDPDANSYTASVMKVMRLGGSLTVLLLGLSLIFLWRKDSRRVVSDETFATIKSQVSLNEG